MSTQPKTQKPKKSTPEQPTTKPAIDDFFTQFLEKRQKNFVKKLAKISELEKKNPAELTPEQQDLVQNKHLTHERIKYFDDIKELYSAAYQKKDSPVATPDPVAQKTAFNPTGHVLNLYFTGHVLQHLPDSSRKAIEVSLSHDHQAKVAETYNRVFTPAHTHDTLDEAKAVLEQALLDAELLNALEQTVGSRALEKHPAQVHVQLVKSQPHEHHQAQHHGHGHAEHKKAEHGHGHGHGHEAHVKAEPKKALFHESSEDEPEEAKQQPRKPQSQNKGGQKEAQQAESEWRPTSLPEDDDKGDEQWIKVGGPSQRGRGFRGRRHHPDNRDFQGEGEPRRHHRRRDQDGNPQDTGNANNEVDNADNEKTDPAEEGKDAPRRRGYGNRGSNRGGPRHDYQEKREEEGGEEKSFRYPDRQQAPQENFVKSNNNRGGDQGTRGGDQGNRGGDQGNRGGDQGFRAPRGERRPEGGRGRGFSRGDRQHERPQNQPRKDNA